MDREHKFLRLNEVCSFDFYQISQFQFPFRVMNRHSPIRYEVLSEQDSTKHEFSYLKTSQVSITSCYAI